VCTLLLDLKLSLSARYKKSAVDDENNAAGPPILAPPLEHAPIEGVDRESEAGCGSDVDDEYDEDVEVEIGRVDVTLAGVLDYLRRSEARAEKRGERLEARLTIMEQKFQNIPLIIQQEYQKLSTGIAVAELATLPDWLSSQDLYNAAQELGFWMPSGVKFSERDLGTLYRKLLDVVVLSDIVTDDQKAPYLGDDGELDEDKINELIKDVKKWDALQSKSLHEHFKVSRTKRTEQHIAIGGKDLAFSRYYDIVLNCEADSDEQIKEQEILRNKMISSKRHDKAERFSEQGYKEFYVYCCKMGSQFKMEEKEWRELMQLESEHPRPQQVTFHGILEKIYASSTYKDGCKNLKIHNRERKRIN
jgi:hypothetical protein